MSAQSVARTWEMYTPAEAVHPSGRTLLILGEAPGADEEKAGIPFIGAAGAQLSRALGESGLDRRHFHILNTFIKRPPNNDLKHESWTLNKTQWKQQIGGVPSTPPLKKRYLRPEHLWQLEELRTRIADLKPDLILAMGGTALWALTGGDGISQQRGNFFKSGFGCDAIATLHPASLLYQWSNMPLQWADLVKVRLYLEGCLPSPLKRRLWINPNWGEIACVFARFNKNPKSLLGVDIETAPSIGQITTISFSTATEGICIPIWDRYASRENQNVYSTVEDEVKAWRWIDRFAQLPNPKVLQNGLYDIQYLLDAPLPIRLRNVSDDTALLQHSLQPELPKALGTLSSLYLNEPSWKQMRLSSKDLNKADE